MEELKTGLILKKLDRFDNAYISLGFDYFEEKDNHCIINCEDEQVILPIFDGKEDISVYELETEKIIELGKYNDVLELFDELNSEDTYQVYTVNKIDEESFQISYEFEFSKDEYNKYANLNHEGIKEPDENAEEIKEDYEMISVKDVYKNVTDAVIGQDSAVKQILSTIYYNQTLADSNLNHDTIRQLKQNIFVVGPTGVGKTEIIKQIAKNIGIPCIIEDSTRYTITGYKGSSVEDMFKNLIMEADWDIDLAERGILVIDEMDKKSAKSDESSATSTGVQYALLKILEGTNYYVESEPNSEFESFEFDTTYLTVILCGAFTSLTQEKTKPSIGFSTTDKETKNNFEIEDIEKYGIIPELLGRMSKIVRLNQLTEEDYLKILDASELSILKLTKEYYENMGININFDEEFKKKIVTLATKKEKGARALKTTFEELLGDLEFELLTGDIESVDFKEEDIKIKRKDVKVRKLTV